MLSGIHNDDGDDKDKDDFKNGVSFISDCYLSKVKILLQDGHQAQRTSNNCW